MADKVTQKVTHSESISTFSDVPHSRHSYRSYSNQSIGYNKQPSGWCLNGPKEHKEKLDLCENWLKVCYLLDIIHSQSILPIFLIIFLNSDIDLLDLIKLSNLFQIRDPQKCLKLVL